MPLAYNLIFTYADEGADTATTSISVPTGFTIADYIQFANDAVVILGAITTGGIKSVTLAVTLDLSTFTGAFSQVAGVLSDIEEKGLFQFISTIGTFKKVSVPTMDETYIMPGGDIDVTAVPVGNFLTLMESGNGTISPTDSRQEDLVGTASAYQYFRKSGKRK